jgi:hypothetical protein
VRRSSLLFSCLAAGFVLLVVVFVHGIRERQSRAADVEAKGRLVRDLALTDLCLFTEARYTRHPSQADLHAPFQDHPASLEHFPTGSLVAPRAGRERHGLD